MSDDPKSLEQPAEAVAEVPDALLPPPVPDALPEPPPAPPEALTAHPFGLPAALAFGGRIAAVEFAHRELGDYDTMALIREMFDGIVRLESALATR